MPTTHVSKPVLTGAAFDAGLIQYSNQGHSGGQVEASVAAEAETLDAKTEMEGNQTSAGGS